MSARIPYVYLLSHPFSGSTLGAFLIGSHPRIATVGEMGIAAGVDPATFTCSCGSPIRSCEFWIRLSERMAEHGHPFQVEDAGLHFRSSGGLADLLLRAGPRGPMLEAARSVGLAIFPSSRQARDRLLARNEEFARTTMALQGGSLFLDISKRPNRLVHLASHPNFDVHVVHLIRDPRGVTCSCMRNLDMELDAGAYSWSRAMRFAKQLRRRFRAERWLQVRHEDLCHAPTDIVQVVQRFLGVEPDDSFTVFREGKHHIIGNRMRLDSSSEIRLDEKWRQELTPQQQSQVMQIAGQGLSALGYE